MAFVVYLYGKAAWTAAEFEQAEQLALPYIRDGVRVVIEGNEIVGTSRRWFFSVDDERWIEQASLERFVSFPGSREGSN